LHEIFDIILGLCSTMWAQIASQDDVILHPGAFPYKKKKKCDGGTKLKLWVHFAPVTPC